MKAETNAPSILHVHYDTRMGPITFDFSNFLACADANRQRINAKSIHLNIIAPRYRDISPRDKNTSASEKEWRVKHILMRLANLVPSIKHLTLHWETPTSVKTPRFPEWYPPPPGPIDKFMPYQVRNVNFLHANGFDVQPYQSSEFARKIVQQVIGDRPYYTISLRTTPFATDRNSKLGEWFKVYNDLCGRGHAVYVIPDFEDAVKSRQAFQHDWRLLDFATYDPDLRLALYEGAIDNLCVNGGISTIMAYSKSPMKMFKIVTEGEVDTSPKKLFQTCEVMPGHSPPYFKQNQKWVWQDDTAENILRCLG